MNQSETTDRELSVMEYFILALIGKAGLTSLYAFQQRAGLQPGGIRSALQHLESRDLITRAKSSTRRRRDMSLTAAGIACLEGTWVQCLSDHPDMEGVLRAACVALLMGPPDCATVYLRDRAAAHLCMAMERSMEAEHMRKDRKDPLSIYAWMRMLGDGQRRNAESQAFTQLSHFLEEKD
jgi:DNA-binding MarR family transcriptional regulator